MKSAQELEDELIKILTVYIDNSNEKQEKHRKGEWKYAWFNEDLAEQKRQLANGLIDFFAKAKQRRSQIIDFIGDLQKKLDTFKQPEMQPEQTDKKEQPTAASSTPSDARLKQEATKPTTPVETATSPQGPIIDKRQVILLSLIQDELDSIENKISRVMQTASALEKEHYRLFSGDLDIHLTNCLSKVSTAKDELSNFRSELERYMGTMGPQHRGPAMHNVMMSGTGNTRGSAPGLMMYNTPPQSLSSPAPISTTNPLAYERGSSPLAYPSTTTRTAGQRSSSGNGKHPLFG